MKEDLNPLKLFLLATFIASVLLTGCGGEEQKTKAPNKDVQPAAAPESEPEPQTAESEVEAVKLLPDPAATSAEPNSFAEVTAKLDQGGGMFGYLATDSFLGSVNDELNDLQKLFTEQAESDEEKESIDSAFQIVTALIENSGIRQLSGVGFSSVAVEDDLYRTKLVFHHRAGENKGYLWKLLGSEPQYLGGLNLLPSSTAAAGFSQFDIGAVWRAITAEIETSGSPEMKQAIQGAPAMIQAMTQMTIDDLFAALGTEFGFVITLDESQMVPLPLPAPEPVQVPAPGALLTMKPGNETLFTRLETLLSKNPMFTQGNNGNRRSFEMATALPFLPDLKPAIVFDGEHLIVGTSPGLINQALDVKSGQGEGFKESDEFKRLARVLPNYGNGFTYVSKRFNDLFNQIQAIGPAENRKMAEMVSGLSPSAESLQVSQVTEEGLIWTGVSSVQPASTMLTALTAGSGAIFAGMAIPAMAKAKIKAAEIKCRNDCVRIQEAKVRWLDQTGKPPDTAVTLANLIESELVDKEIACRESGEFSVGPLGTHANCSKHKHPEFPKKEVAQ